MMAVSKYNDTRHYESKQNDTKHNETKHDYTNGVYAKYRLLSVTYAECRYECSILFLKLVGDPIELSSN